jgi:hypothetical protein
MAPTGRYSNELADNNVSLTPGQKGLTYEGQGTLPELAGRTVNAVEEGLGSSPFVGSTIRSARAESVDEFQEGAFNQALGELDGVAGVRSSLPSKGMAPTARHAFTQRQFDKIYDQARSGMQVLPDKQLFADMQRVGQDVATLSDVSQRRFTNILEQYAMPKMRAGTMDGNAFKSVVSDIKRQITKIRKSPNGDDELAEALGDFVATLDAAARRHSPAKFVEMMDKADRGYAKFVLIEDAARRVGGQAGEFTPRAFERAVQNSGNRVRSKAYLQGEGLMQEYAKQGNALVDRIPNSGTPERAALVLGATGAAGGAAYVDPTSAGLLGGLAVLYSPLGRKIPKGMVGRAGPKRRKVGQAISSSGQTVGRLAAGGAVASNE